MSRKIKLNVLLFLFTISCILFTVAPTVVSAKERIEISSGEYYEIDAREDFICSEENKRETRLFTFFNMDKIGTLSVSGSNLNVGTFNGIQAYGAVGEVVLHFDYNGAFHSGKKSLPNIVSCNEKKVDGISLKNSVAKGTIIVCKSKNGTDWESVAVIRNVFEKNEAKTIEILTIKEDEVREGYYYRVLIAYEMSKADGDGFMDWKKNKKFLEEYTFYVSFGGNPIVLRDLMTREPITMNSSVKEGFIVDKGGTDYTVTVTKKNGGTKIVHDMKTVSEPGYYTVTVTTALKSKFTSNIMVTEGIEFRTLNPQVHEIGKKEEYSLENPVVDKTSFGTASLTTIKIGQVGDSGITTAKKDGIAAFGMKENIPNLFISLTNTETLARNGWEVYSDEWKKKEK